MCLIYVVSHDESLNKIVMMIITSDSFCHLQRALSINNDKPLGIPDARHILNLIHITYFFTLRLILRHLYLPGSPFIYLCPRKFLIKTFTTTVNFILLSKEYFMWKKQHGCANYWWELPCELPKFYVKYKEMPQPGKICCHIYFPRESSLTVCYINKIFSEWCSK